MMKLALMKQFFDACERVDGWYRSPLADVIARARTCEEIVGASAIDFSLRGVHTTISTFGDAPILESNCVSCGECVANCPVGALVPKKEMHVKPAYEVLTTCSYCGCGCGIYLGVRGDEIVSARGDPDNPASFGNLCVKGRYGFGLRARLTDPLIKRNGKFESATWEEALDLVAKKMMEIKGKIAENEDYFGFIASAKCTNEDNYVMQKFARAVMGTNNVDHCARLCHAPTVAGLVQSFGSGAITNSQEDVEESDVIFVIGSNTSEQHPLIARSIIRAVKNGSSLLVADPRKKKLAEYASVYLPQRPGTDVALLNAMMNVIIEEGLHNEEFIGRRTEDFEGLKEAVSAYTPGRAEAITGVPADDIRGAALLYGGAERASIFFSMGITQHTTGVDNVVSTANLAMLTGNIGRAGTGVNPLRGQNNVKGACDMGALPDYLPGYGALTDPQTRGRFEEAWGGLLPSEVGLTIVEMIDGCGEEIKAMFIMGENPLVSDPDLNHVREQLGKLDFLVVSELFLSETAQIADVVLPASSFAEKDGTFTATDRRVQRVRKAIEPIGESRPDWMILSNLSGALGYPMVYESPEDIMHEITSLATIYDGIQYSRLGIEGLRWPCLDREHPGTRILHQDRFSRGLGRFQSVEYRPPAEEPDGEYPYILTTGRLLFHWHTGTMTRRSVTLTDQVDESIMEINVKDAAELGVSFGDTVRVRSCRGEISLKVETTGRIKEGVVFIPFHFAEAATNVLTNPAFDPTAKIPELEVCAVQIERP